MIFIVSGIMIACNDFFCDRVVSMPSAFRHDARLVYSFIHARNSVFAYNNLANVASCVKNGFRCVEGTYRYLKRQITVH